LTATLIVDDDQGTSAASTAKHAMRNLFESKQTARALANQWVTGHMLKAQQEWCSCDNGEHLSALLDFGMALHTVQDSTSPSQHGFQVWQGLWNIYAAEAHVAAEDFDPGPNSQLDQATKWLWGFMQCPAPPLPSDFFRWRRDYKP